MSTQTDVLPLLAGEGETRTVTSTRVRRECDNCGEPATKRHMYCYTNGRRNPASSMYRRDDCTYCEDATSYACDECSSDVRRVTCPEGMEWGGTYKVGGHHDHMFLYWAESNARLIAGAPDLLAACKAALGAFTNNDAIDWHDLSRAIAKATQP